LWPTEAHFRPYSLQRQPRFDPSRKRPFRPQELAELLTGDEYKSVTAAIMEVGEITQRAILADRAFETGRGSPEGAVHVALKSRDRQALNAVP
jgi:hypothetical protein